MFSNSQGMDACGEVGSCLSKPRQQVLAGLLVYLRPVTLTRDWMRA